MATNAVESDRKKCNFIVIRRWLSLNVKLGLDPPDYYRLKGTEHLSMVSSIRPAKMLTSKACLSFQIDSSLNDCLTCTIEATEVRYVSAHQENETEKESKFIQTDPTSGSEAFNHMTNNSTGTSPNSESTETGPGSNSGTSGAAVAAAREAIPVTETCLATPIEFSSNHVHEELRTLSSAVSQSKARATAAAANNRHDTRSGHARTHKIIINLDDKERFTEEVIV